MFPTLPATAGTAIIKPIHRFGRGITIGDVVVAKHPWFVGEGVGKRVLGMPGDYVILDPPSSAVANVDEGPTKTLIVAIADIPAAGLIALLGDASCTVGTVYLVPCTCYRVLPTVYSVPEHLTM